VDKRKKSASTVKDYGYAIAKHINPAIGNHRLQAVTKDILQDFYDDLEMRCSSSMVRRVNKVLRKAFNDAIDNEKLSKNPCAKVILPEETEYEPKIYTIEESLQLINAVKGAPCELPVLIALGLGIRLGEAIGTDIKDWDFEHNTVYLHQQIGLVAPYAKGRLQYGIIPHLKSSGKKIKKNRHLPVPPALMAMVKTRIQKIKQDKNATPYYKDLGLLCCGDDGDFLEPHAVRRNYKRVLDRNGMDSHRFHDLRGSQITMLYENGAPVESIARNAGHEGDRMLRQRYIKSKKVDYTCANMMQELLFDGFAQTELLSRN
jgi:integrase